MATTKDLKVKVADLTTEGLAVDARNKNAIYFTDLEPTYFEYFKFSLEGDKLTAHFTFNNTKLIVSNPSAIKYAKDKDNSLTDLITENLIDNLNDVEYNAKKKAYVGTVYNDYFTSDAVDEKFIGGIGKNTFYYSKAKGGHDVIELTNKENLILDLSSDINKNDIELKYANKNKDLVLYIDENNSITLKNYVAKNVVGTGSIILKTKDNLPNGVRLDTQYITTTITTDSDYTGTRLNDDIYAIGAQEKLKKGKHVDLAFKGGAGDDFIESSLFADKITGGTGENIYSYTYFKQLDGDKIYLTKGENAIIDIAIEGAKATYQVNGKNLDVMVSDGENEATFTIMNFGTKDVTNTSTKKNPIDTSSVILSDSTGVKELRTGVRVNSDVGTYHNDNIDRSDYYNKKGKGLTINGGAGQDYIVGTDYADTIKAGAGVAVPVLGYAEKLTGGKGNDKLYSSTTENMETVFYFNKGDGVDTIYNAGKKDQIVINAVAKEDLRYVKNGKDLEIFYSDSYDSDNKIIVKNYYKTAEADRITKLLAHSQAVDLSTVDVVDAKSGKINATANGDVLVGSAKADTIKADTFDDVVIAGGKGNDKLYASTTAATNTTFKFNLGDGKDTVYSGSGDDTVCFDEYNIADLTFSKGSGKSADDLIIKYSDKDSVTIKDYYKTTNTIKHIKTKEDTFNIADVLDTEKFIIGSGNIEGNAKKNIIIGSDDDDTIFGYAEHDEIYGKGGTDEIYGGAGDDTIYISKENEGTTIFVEKGDGNDTLVGPERNVYLNSESLLHSVELGEGMTYNYYTGNKYNRDLILKMSDSVNTFTVKDFYSSNGVPGELKSANLDTYLCDESGNLILDNKIREHLYLTGNVVNLTESDYPYDEDDSNKLIIGSSDSKTVTLTGDSNGLALTGKSNKVNINGSGSKVYVYNTSDTSINTINIGDSDHTELYNNRVHAYGRTTVNMADDGFEGNYIKIDQSYNSTVNTSQGGRTIVDIDAKNSVENYINSKGSDTLMFGLGNYKINLFAGDYDEKTLTLSPETEKVVLNNASDLYGVAVVSKTDITHQFSTTPVDIMFEHHNNTYHTEHPEDYQVNNNVNNLINIKYLDENGNKLNNTTRLLQMYGKWDNGVFDLNTEEVGNKVTITAESSTSSVTKKLSEMTQLVDLNMTYYNSDSENYDKELLFDEKAQNGFLDNRAGLWIEDELASHRDDYSNYAFNDGTNQGHGKVTINDAGGADRLLLDMDRNDYRFFVDINESGGINGDLIIFSHTGSADTDGLLQYLDIAHAGSEDYHAGDLNTIGEYVHIKNSFTPSSYSGAGAIEKIEDNDSIWNVGNVDSYVDTVKGDVTGWIQSYNVAYGADCGSVTEALADGQASVDKLNELYSIYCRTDEQWAAY